MKSIPLLNHKHYDQPSVFTAHNLLREARRQKHLQPGIVPKICILDPDGDILSAFLATNQAHRDPQWACYHTDLYCFEQEGLAFGLIGSAVGASFAVLVAEELFVCGCELLISITSAGQIKPAVTPPPYFVLIEQALRDEGTSYHYQPPADFSYLASDLSDLFSPVLANALVPVYQGTSWTTDAPFRETETAIEACRALGILAVEMEAAALYAFAEAAQRSVVCFAYVTNQMAVVEGDFEKGDAAGSVNALNLINLLAQCWISTATA